MIISAKMDEDTAELLFRGLSENKQRG